MVYEARPNVTVDAAVILIKSGNAALLRGSSSAANSNKILIEVMKKAFNETSISPDVLQLVPSTDRSTVTALLTARGFVDLVIPRGSAELIRMVVDESTVPTIETGAGVCHVYVDKSADLEKAIPILINSKCNRPSTCNSAETLLVDKSIADKFLPLALKALTEANVAINADTASKVVADKLGISAKLATEKSWSTEYGTLEINVAQVDGVKSAVEHIFKYGTKHTEAIVAEDKEAIEIFTKLNDCVAVMVNTSTRFTDGEEMGFGAEIGISNQKLHARGPMGLEQMTTTSAVLCNSGNSGSIISAIDGGTAPYSYLWSNAATSASISNLVSGSYTVTVTDDHGCSISLTSTVTEPAAPLATSAVTTDILCHANTTGAIDLSVTGGTTPYTYNWSNNATSQDIR